MYVYYIIVKYNYVHNVQSFSFLAKFVFKMYQKIIFKTFIFFRKSVVWKVTF